MANGQPKARKNKPNDVAQEAQATSANVFLVGQFFSADGFLAEREKSKQANHETSPAPGDAHDGEKGQQAQDPPTETHDKASKNEPQEIADQTHDIAPFVLKVRKDILGHAVSTSVYLQNEAFQSSEQWAIFHDYFVDQREIQ
jgi:hypothetical protein